MLLHVVTDWPGHVPNRGDIVATLVDADADVNARCTGSHTDMPLHWAAAGDDVEALHALLDAGGLDRHVGAGSDGEADVGSGRGGSVVDAVADRQTLCSSRRMRTLGRARAGDADLCHWGSWPLLPHRA